MGVSFYHLCFCFQLEIVLVHDSKVLKFNGGKKLSLEMFVFPLTEEKMGVSETVGISFSVISYLGVG